VADDRPQQADDARAAMASASSVFAAADGRPGSWIPLWRIVGIIFVVYPLVRIIERPPEPPVSALVLAATAGFAYLIWFLARRAPDDPRRARPSLAILNVAILACAAAATVRSGNEEWVVLFYYASTAASLLLPERRALAIVIAAGLVTAATLGAFEDPASAVVQGLSVSVIGVTVFAIAALRRSNADLHAARQALATRAVADERDRIARDLHDLLGHSLSLIAIKSELAGRLLPTEPDRAREEIGDIERVARDALASVRETVSGYRQPTLDREIANAREVLDAAGIEPSIEHRAGSLPIAEDAVLAWAVREGVTNIVRHSLTRHATIRTARHGALAELEVLDDGPAQGGSTPGAEGGPDGGTGLRGLRERLERAGGRLEAGPRTSGGYRLFASVPIAGTRASSG
jgi:two-component system sensor histidine kinase DesK